MSPLRLLAIASLGICSALAQAPPLPPGIDPSQLGQTGEGGGDAQVPIVRPDNFDPNIPLGENLIIEDIIQPKLNGNDLAGWYRIYTGRRVIVSSSAAQAEFSFIQDASPEDPLTYAQAAALLRKAATIENFIFVPDATDDNLDILTLATGGIQPRTRGIEYFTENDKLPDGDAVIGYIMSFDHIKPESAVNAFSQIVGQFSAFGSIAPIPNTASVVITENTSLIRRLIDLKREIDKPSAQVATRFIPVQYADVTELAATLNELLNAQQQTQTTAGIQRAEATPPPGIEGILPPATVGGGSEPGGQAGETTPIQIIPDPRTSRIFAMGRPVDLLFVEGLIREFDTETDNRTFLRRKLRFLTVSEFLPIAGNALTRAFGGTGDAGSTGGGATNTRGQSNRAGGGATSGFDAQQGGFGGQTGGRITGGSSGSTRGSSLSNPNVSSAPDSLLVGRTLLVADNITNSVIVQGPPSGIEIIERLLDQLDVKADQVMISTVFGQLSLGDGIETGIDYLYQGGNVSGRGGAGQGPSLPLSAFIPAIPAVIDPITDAIISPARPAAGSPFLPGEFAGGPGLRMYGRIGDLNIYLRALQSKSNFTVLSRPSIFTSNNQLGTISSGRRIAVPTNSNQFNNSLSTNIEYRDVVLKLEVIPLINDENTVTLQIALVSDDVIGQSDPIEGIGTVPIIGTREILTTVTVPNNETVVLGGLITTNEEDSMSGIPILSSIPGIGRLFSSKSKTFNRDELLVFIQPSIINSDRTLDTVQADMDSRYRVSGPAREFGDGPGILPDAEAIPATQEKGSRSTRQSAPPAAAPEESTRRNLRPIHRR